MQFAAILFLGCQAGTRTLLIMLKWNENAHLNEVDVSRRGLLE